MGFIVMVLSAIVGIALTVTGTLHIKNQRHRTWNIIAIVLGVVLVLFAIWLGLPK